MKTKTPNEDIVVEKLYSAGLYEGKRQEQERILKIIDERIKHPLYMFDADKLDKKVLKISAKDFLADRIKVITELRNQIIKGDEQNG